MFFLLTTRKPDCDDESGWSERVVQEPLFDHGFIYHGTFVYFGDRCLKVRLHSALS